MAPSSPPSGGPPRAPRVRLTALAGAAAALALAGAFFLPLWQIDRGEAARFAAGVRAEAGATDDALLEDFVGTFETIAETGRIEPADVLRYARTAPHERERLRRARRVRLHETAAPGPLARHSGDVPGHAFDRVLTVLAMLVGGVPLGAALLLIYFVGNRFRRARSPALILATVVGLAGLLVPTAYQYASLQLSAVLERDVGLVVQGLASFTLLLVAVFGVTVRNWWRVLGGALITTTALGVLGWAYVRYGMSA